MCAKLFNSGFENRIKQALKQKGVTAKYLCEQLEISRQNLRNIYIKGYTNTEHLTKMCKILDTTPNYLLGYESGGAVLNESAPDYSNQSKQILFYEQLLESKNNEIAANLKVITMLEKKVIDYEKQLSIK